MLIQCISGSRKTLPGAIGGTALEFTHDQAGLKVKLPARPPSNHAYALKIRGLRINPNPNTRDGNPGPL